MKIEKENSTSSIGKLLEYFKERIKGTRIDDKIEYYLLIALAVASRSTCLRRNYGSVIVKDDLILSTGYNGAPRNYDHCIDSGNCFRETHHIPHGERYELCKAVHSEVNAIIDANGRNLNGSTLYLMGFDCITNKLIQGIPCKICKPILINAGIQKVITACEQEENFIFPIITNLQ